MAQSRGQGMWNKITERSSDTSAEQGAQYELSISSRNQEPYGEAIIIPPPLQRHIRVCSSLM